MKHFLEIEGQLNVSPYGASARAIELTVIKADADRVCLGLALLHFELVDSLTLRSRASQEQLIMKRGDSGDAGEWSEERHRLALSSDTLEHLLAYLLELHRDGLAPVDHVDVFLESRNKEEELSLLLKTEDFKPPMSADEARRLLDGE